MQQRDWLLLLPLQQKPISEQLRVGFFETLSNHLKRLQLLLALPVMLAPNTLQAQEKIIPKNKWGVLNADIVFSDEEDNLDLSWGINYNFGYKLLYHVGFKHFIDFTLVGPSEIRASYLNVSRGLATSGRYHNVAVFG